MNLLTRIRGAIKGFTQPSFWVSGSGSDAGLLPVQGFNERIWNSSIVGPCLGWITRVFHEAPLSVERLRDGEWERIPHPLVETLRRPNEAYSGRVLISATILSLVSDGNAYWRKVGQDLRYLPHFRVFPKSGDGKLIAVYEYMRADGRIERLQPDEVIHFRDGLDPDDEKVGRSPLKAVMMEVLTDAEAAVYSWSIMKKMGVPGAVISGGDMSADDAERLKEFWRRMTTGTARGDPVVLAGDVKVDAVGFKPADMVIDKMRAVPEERISAAIGVPAAVVGLGTGMQQTKVGATMAELREQAWESCIIPLQCLLAEVMSHHLLPGQTDLRIAFDNSKVRVLQEDLNKLGSRLAEGVKVGAVTIADYRRAMGLNVLDSEEVYLWPTGVLPVNRDELQEVAAQSEPEPTAPERRNGERTSTT